MFSDAGVDLTAFFKSIANERRLQILFSVFADKQAHSVGEVAAALGLPVSSTSEHLAVLRNAGVLCAEKRLKEVYYRVDQANFQHVVNVLQRWINCC